MPPYYPRDLHGATDASAGSVACGKAPFSVGNRPCPEEAEQREQLLLNSGGAPGCASWGVLWKGPFGGDSAREVLSWAMLGSPFKCYDKSPIGREEVYWGLASSKGPR